MGNENHEVTQAQRKGKLRQRRKTPLRKRGDQDIEKAGHLANRNKGK